MLDNSGLIIEKAFGNLNDPGFIDGIMKDIDTVMHIYNIHHSVNVVQAAKRNRVKRVILIHTTGIYSKFKNATKEYERIERQIEKLRNDPNCPSITILRPSMIYGDICDKNISKFIRMVDKFRIMPVINGGNSLIQPVNARDLGKAFYDVLTSEKVTDGKDYDLTGDRPIRMITVFKLISDALNKKTHFISVPLSIGELMAKILKLFTLGKIDYVERVQRMGEDRSYSHEDATHDFGYNPLMFEDGLKLEVKEYQRKKQKVRNVQ